RDSLTIGDQLPCVQTFGYPLAGSVVVLPPLDNLSLHVSKNLGLGLPAKIGKHLFGEGYGRIARSGHQFRTRYDSLNSDRFDIGAIASPKGRTSRRIQHQRPTRHVVQQYQNDHRVVARFRLTQLAREPDGFSKATDRINHTQIAVWLP